MEQHLAVLIIGEERQTGEQVQNYLLAHQFQARYIQTDFKVPPCLPETTGICFIILQLNMAGQNGIEIFNRYKQDARFAGIPFMVMLSPDQSEYLPIFFSGGATDFILTPPVEAEVVLKIAAHLHQAENDPISEQHSGKYGNFQECEKELNLIIEMSEWLRVCLTPQEAYPIIGRFAEKCFNANPGALYINNKTSGILEAKSLWGNITPALPHYFSLEDCWAIRRSRPHVVVGDVQRLDCPHLQTIQPHNKTAYICNPLSEKGELLGIFHQHLSETQDDSFWVQLVNLACGQISLALTNLNLNEKIRLQSIRDPLTNLYSRYYMEETLDRELLRATRHKQPLGILMLELDPAYNSEEKRGPEIEDLILQELGAFLHNSVRGEDVPCRYGKNEFVVILPEVNLGRTKKRADQIRQEFKTLKIQHNGKLVSRLTISVGVASFPIHGTTSQELIHTTRQALNQARAEGRDRTCAIHQGS